MKEGVDPKYGARHLKRAIERLLVQPLSNLMATDQIRSGDWIEVDATDSKFSFQRRDERLPIQAMAELVDLSVDLPLSTLANAFGAEPVKATRARRG